jgi:hypothetical protein
MGMVKKLPALLGAIAALGGVAALAGSATGASGPSVIRLKVPIAAARAHQIDAPPRGPSPGDSFQESYRPAHAGMIRGQDAVGIGTFDRGMFLGAITLANGQIVYAGATTNQDDTEYAIVGGTGAYRDARGTVTTHSLAHARVLITIAVDR